MTAPRRGDRLGSVQLGELIGEGAVARVFAATDRKLAVKVLRRTAEEDAEAHERLKREAKILSGLAHPGLLRVHEVDVAPSGHPYLIMERVGGSSLADRLAEGPLPLDEAWRVVRAAAVALAAAHEAGVLHRDLKPSNLLLGRSGEVRVTDFGLALKEGDPRLTRDRAATGTPAYMAPEQWWGAPMDARTDVYGLGAVLYEALGGAPPWRGTTDDLLHRIATSEPERLSGVTEPIATFVARCLSREATGRPADLAAFLREGDAAFGHQAPTRWLEATLAAVALLGSAVAVGFGGRHDPRFWIYEAGYGGYTLPVIALGAVALLRFRAGRVIAPFIPLLIGALTAATGFGATMRGVARASLEQRFIIFHAGQSEAVASLYMGAFFSAALALFVGLRGTAGRRPRLLAVILAAGALGAAALAADRAVVVAAVAAAVLLLRQGPAHRAAHLAGAAGTVLALCVAAWARHTSAAARLWTAGLERGERALQITEASQHFVTLTGAMLCVLLAVLVAGRWRALRATRRKTLLLGGCMTVLSLAALGVPWLVMRAERRVLWDELATRFSIWRELDPPGGKGGRPARVGPTLQIGRRSVAVDGDVVAPRQALRGEGRTGPLLIAGRLGRALRLDRSPQLVLAADRSLPWPEVGRVLAAAHDLGVRRVDLIYLPGRVPPLSPAAPPEAAFVLPEDLRALDVALVRSEAALPPRTYGEVAGKLLGIEQPRLTVR